jgi:hypothetical protein
MKQKQAEFDDGWNSTHCTRPKCRQAMDPGAGNQFLDESGRQQRYCWKHWVEYNADPKRFPGSVQT